MTIPSFSSGPFSSNLVSVIRYPLPNVAATATDSPQDKTPCISPKAVYTPDAVPPDSWVGKGPRTARTDLEVKVDKKGKEHDPVVIRSGGDDADKAAIEAVRR